MQKMMPLVEIIGIGLGLQDLTAQHLELVQQAEVLVGGSRHLALFPEARAEKIRIGSNIQAVCRALEERMDRRKVVVLASGDPLFYGIGAVLIQRLGRDRVRIHPNISSVAAAFARIKHPWSEAGLLSLHGRQGDADLERQLKGRKLCAVLTDRSRTPAWVASRLMDQGQEMFDMCVLERLGAADERVGWYALEEAARTAFHDPNIVILKRRSMETTPVLRSFVPGMPDTCFAHSRGLITKAEIRAVTLSKLELLPECVVWDLGAGCGSVGIEAALLVAPGQVAAVEKNESRISEIRENQERFQVENLEIIQAELPEGLSRLPAPHRIFIGGGGEGLAAIMTEAGKYLLQEGIMVVNTVLLENVQAGRQAMQALGLQTDLVQVQVGRSKAMPWGARLQAQNPVWILQGRKPESKRSPEKGD